MPESAITFPLHKPQYFTHVQVMYAPVVATPEMHHEALWSNPITITLIPGLSRSQVDLKTSGLNATNASPGLAFFISATQNPKSLRYHRQSWNPNPLYTGR